MGEKVMQPPFCISDDFLLPADVIAAAMEVCTDPDFLEQLRYECWYLKSVAWLDRLPNAQGSPVARSKNTAKTGAKILNDLKDWLDRSGGIAELQMAYWQVAKQAVAPGDQLLDEVVGSGKGLVAFAADCHARMKDDIEAVRRLSNHLSSHSASINGERGQKGRKNFLPQLADCMCRLCDEFGVGRPPCTESGAVVGLMVKIAAGLNMPTQSASSSRKALEVAVLNHWGKKSK